MEEGLKISELPEIVNPTGEEMIPVAIINEETEEGENGHIKLKNLTCKMQAEYDEKTQTLILK